MAALSFFLTRLPFPYPAVSTLLCLTLQGVVFVIIVLVLATVYVGGGLLYNRRTKHVWQFPNHDSWSRLFSKCSTSVLVGVVPSRISLPRRASTLFAVKGVVDVWYVIRMVMCARRKRQRWIVWRWLRRRHWISELLERVETWWGACVLEGSTSP